MSMSMSMSTSTSTSTANSATTTSTTQNNGHDNSSTSSTSSTRMILIHVLICENVGELLICDGCERSYHRQCLDPPLELENVPDGDFGSVLNAVMVKGTATIIDNSPAVAVAVAAAPQQQQTQPQPQSQQPHDDGADPHMTTLPAPQPVSTTTTTTTTTMTVNNNNNNNSFVPPPIVLGSSRPPHPLSCIYCHRGKFSDCLLYCIVLYCRLL